MSDLDLLRHAIRGLTLQPEGPLIGDLIRATGLDPAARTTISSDAEALVEAVRASARPGLMESFLAEYGLDSEEGLALMSLAEALLRVPDSETVDALIHDKVAGSDWSAHFGASGSPFVNFSTWALSLTSDVLGEPSIGPMSVLHGVIRRLGEPVIRVAVGQAMRLLGSQFVFGRTIDEALGAAAGPEAEGYRFSFDMLGEAARTADDAARYHAAYSSAIKAIGARAGNGSVRDNPGISVKLSALHPRYEYAKRDRVLAELVPATLALARQAATAGIGFNIDAEEADRLELSLDIIAGVLADPALAGWDGFGVVVQAYGKRALPVLDWLNALAETHDRRIMVRLVKGAYWDAEIKRAQVLGLEGYPVFTRKAATDVSYIAAARKLLAMDRIYPQFATHNAHTTAAILHLAREAAVPMEAFEFQRLHGMGETLHRVLHEERGSRTRIYAPVGPHRDLLAYLVRRLLENGANGSFVYQIADLDLPASKVAEDPIARVEGSDGAIANAAIPAPAALFPARRNSAGLDLTDPEALGPVLAAREAFRAHRWQARPIIAGPVTGEEGDPVANPADPADIVGTVLNSAPDDIETAIKAATTAVAHWSATPASVRAGILRRIAALYEDNRAELFALLAREAGKTLADAVSEVREAVDFLRYYAGEAEGFATATARGVITCISPWNFPLAIFTGQIAAALAAGNTVLAKPAAQTPLIATRAVELMLEAGVPAGVIQLLTGEGASVGAALTGDRRIDGISFTGSLPTARRIEQAMAGAMAPGAPLIAETGGINAMIVDSTALPEQAVRDIIASAFQSAGQRCSALRILYVQEDIAGPVLTMLKGAMAELSLGDPWVLATDIGPVIDAAARRRIEAHVAAFAAKGKLVARLDPPAGAGLFVAPTVLSVSGIEDIADEVFGPVLHVATFAANQLDAVIAAINGSGYGLTFALHTRLSSRVAAVSAAVQAGNIYVNRNQIGAVVESQPFGGEGLSGTGPKAGGPHYLPRFLADAPDAPPDLGQRAMPGPTGERNTLETLPRGPLLCLGPSAGDRLKQEAMAQAAGCAALPIPADFSPAMLETLGGIAAVAYFGDPATARAIRIALSRRDGALLPLLASPRDGHRLIRERHVSIDTTAAGGNTTLMTGAAEE